MGGSALGRVRLAFRWRRKALLEWATSAWSDFRTRYARSAKTVTRRNTRRAYERLYGADDLVEEYLQPIRLRFYDEVADRLAPLDPHRVLDAGCGTGHLVRALAERLPQGREFTGVDFSRKGIERAQSVLPSGRWLVGDLYRLRELLPGEQFDLVVCTEVLEHVARPESALEALVAVCAPGGHVAITVPDGELDDWEGHANFWNEREFRALLARRGHADVSRIEDGRTFLALLRPRG